MILSLLFQVSVLAPIAPVDTLKVGVVGDNQLNAFATFDSHCRAMQTAGINLFVGLGDHVQDHGLPGEWQRLWLTPLAPIAGVPRIGCIGNHDDVLGYTTHVWPSQQHPLTSIYGNAIGVWSAITVGAVRFVFLDTNEHPTIRLSLQAGGAQAAWLQAELAGVAWQSARYRVACWHHPVATSLWAGCNYPRLPERVWILDTVAVGRCSLVLNGHSHSYQRGTYRGVPWIISGGGGGWLDTTSCPGAPEITVAQAVWHWGELVATPDTLTWTARDTAGQQIDTLTIR